MASPAEELSPEQKKELITRNLQVWLAVQCGVCVMNRQLHSYKHEVFERDRHTVVVMLATYISMCRPATYIHSYNASHTHTHTHTHTQHTHRKCWGKTGWKLFSKKGTGFASTGAPPPQAGHMWRTTWE